MLENLSKRKGIASFSISPENFTGEKEKGRMPADAAAAFCLCRTIFLLLRSGIPIRLMMFILSFLTGIILK